MTQLAGLIPEAALTIDARGQPCPLPLLKLKQALRALNSGEKVWLIASDPHSQQDITRFCAIAGHVLHETRNIDDHFYFLIEKSD